MPNVSTQTVHPLTAMVAKDSQRDTLGHLVFDRRGDREYRFVRFKGESTASQGMAVVALQLSAVADEVNDVIVFASANLAAASRDFMGIVVGQSTAGSGDFGYIMTRGQLGKLNRSMYPDTIFANVSTTTAAGDRLAALVGSGTSEYKLITQTVASAGAMITEYAHIVAVALSTDTSGKLTRGQVRSGLLHGGGYGAIV